MRSIGMGFYMKSRKYLKILYYLMGIYIIFVNVMGLLRALVILTIVNMKSVNISFLNILALTSLPLIGIAVGIGFIVIVKRKFRI